MLVTKTNRCANAPPASILTTQTCIVKTGFWLALLLSSAFFWMRSGGPETLSIRWPARPTILPCHVVSRPGVAKFQEHVCWS